VAEDVENIKNRKFQIPRDGSFSHWLCPKGTSQGDKGGATPLAAVAAAGVGVGAGEGDLLKTCGRIENS
jgi:hypothetical protein